MKKNIFYLIIFILISCGGSKIVIKEDTKNNSKIITMEMKHGIKNWTNAALHVLGGTYYREIKNNGEIKATTITLPFNTITNTSDLTDQAFIIIDSVKYNMQVLDKKSSMITTITDPDYYNSDNGYVDWPKKNDSDISANTHKEMKILLELPDTIAQNILKAHSISYRLYAGNDPITLEVSDKQFSEIKEFLQIGTKSRMHHSKKQ